MKNDIFITEGINTSTYEELTLKDLVTMVADLDTILDDSKKSKPSTLTMHLNEHIIPFWHQEGLLRSMLDDYDCIIQYK